MAHAPAERLASAVRRWLLLSGRWREHPRLVGALQAQAGLNGGAWPFDDAERAQLEQPGGAAMLGAYVARRPATTSPAGAFGDAVTGAVAAQYEGWPYPAWTRITRPQPRLFRETVGEMDPALAEGLPDAVDILVAGCGTGRQAAAVAARYPAAKVTAIDISEASLAYARSRCAALGLSNLTFHRRDLNEAASLGAFHAVSCGGVLHHLADPERGFQSLAQCLRPRGVMRIMVYNVMQRLAVRAARGEIADLVQPTITDDILRQIRRRLLPFAERPIIGGVVRSRDFSTLPGVHDLVAHRHEDPFDISRIERALDGAGLSLLQFELPTPSLKARYRRAFPDDPRRQDTRAWARFVRETPELFAGHFEFWCCKRGD